MNISLAGKSILVTGGTGSLGSVLVEKLIQEKSKVFFTYYQNEKKAGEFQKKGAIGFQLNLSDRDSIRDLKKRLKETTPHLDGLVNNAATLFDKTISKLPLEEWDRVVEINLTSVFLITKTLLSLLYKSEKAKIVNIASRVGIVGGFGQSNYAAAKGGLIGFSKSLAKEVGRKGISVNVVNPGFMITGMNQDLPEALLESKRAESCLNCYSDPQRVSDFILFFLSDRADTVTGQVFNIDSR